MSALIAGLAGTVCGVLSGLGIGGGTLLMVWMTAVMGIEQKSAQGVNLLFFLPTAACALGFHIKNRLIRPRVVLPAILAGCVSAAGAAFLATAMDTGVLRRLFGGFLIVVGLTELFGRQRDRKER
ncbi:MAG: sulfite exporter TauE/SafE family protein [Oscillospiraceae bacterium]|nr:sulfite exporter TauE/SafE family protein [Oscillospiraceae bacterium]